MSKKYWVKNINVITDTRGEMCVITSNIDIPFTIKRIFYDFNNKNDSVKRGCHANIVSRFVCICVKGSCEISLDDGENKETVILNSPSQILYIDNMVWKEMYNFSDDSVLLLLSDNEYDSSEYIKDYKVFLKEVKK